MIQLHCIEDEGIEISTYEMNLRRFNSCKNELSKLWQLDFYFILFNLFSKKTWLDGPWSLDWTIHTLYKTGLHRYDNLYASSRGNWSSLTIWWLPLILNLNIIFGACCFGVLPKLLTTIDAYNRQHPHAREFASFLKSKWPSTWIKSLRSIILLHLKKKINGTHTGLF